MSSQPLPPNLQSIVNRLTMSLYDIDQAGFTPRRTEIALACVAADLHLRDVVKLAAPSSGQWLAQNEVSLDGGSIKNLGEPGTNSSLARLRDIQNAILAFRFQNGNLFCTQDGVQLELQYSDDNPIVALRFRLQDGDLLMTQDGDFLVIQNA